MVRREGRSSSIKSKRRWLWIPARASLGRDDERVEFAHWRDPLARNDEGPIRISRIPGGPSDNGDVKRGALPSIDND